jgi:hypothetical protein
MSNEEKIIQLLTSINDRLVAINLFLHQSIGASALELDAFIDRWGSSSAINGQEESRSQGGNQGQG